MKYRLLILVLALQTGGATAGSYSFSDMPENEDAPRIAICQDFMENLKRLGNLPMVCDRKFHPSMKQFTWPQWKPIDVFKHRGLVEQIWQQRYEWAYHEDSLLAHANPPLAQSSRQEHTKRKASFAEKAHRGDIHLEVTQISIEGVSRTVLQLREWGKEYPCKPDNWQSSYPIRQFFIVDRSLQRVDFAATDESVLRGYYSNSNEKRPDLFFYNSKPYISFWDGNGRGRGTIAVFGDYDNYCYIDFRSNIEGAHK